METGRIKLRMHTIIKSQVYLTAISKWRLATGNPVDPIICVFL
jgi:hypothetical protein